MTRGAHRASQSSRWAAVLTGSFFKKK